MTKKTEFDRGFTQRKKTDFYTKLHKRLRNQCNNYADEPDKIKYLTDVSFNQEFDDWNSPNDEMPKNCIQMISWLYENKINYFSLIFPYLAKKYVLILY